MFPSAVRRATRPAIDDYPSRACSKTPAQARPGPTPPKVVLRFIGRVFTTAPTSSTVFLPQADGHPSGGGRDLVCENNRVWIAHTAGPGAGWMCLPAQSTTISLTRRVTLRSMLGVRGLDEGLNAAGGWRCQCPRTGVADDKLIYAYCQR